MSISHDYKDPTAALFLSEAAANRAARLVLREYPDRVSEALPRVRRRSGEILGHVLIIHFKDKRPATPLTNSDFERLAGA